MPSAKQKRSVIIIILLSALVVVVVISVVTHPHIFILIFLQIRSLDFLVEHQLKFVLKKVVAMRYLIAFSWTGTDQAIEPYSQRIIQHMWYNIGQYLAVDFDARIGIDLNQPALQILVDHNVDSEYFEVVGLPFWVNERVGRKYNIYRYLLDLRHNFSVEIVLWVPLSHVFV
jgi:hypothetical protein